MLRAVPVSGEIIYFGLMEAGPRWAAIMARAPKGGSGEAEVLLFKLSATKDKALEEFRSQWEELFPEVISPL